MIETVSQSLLEGSLQEAKTILLVKLIQNPLAVTIASCKDPFTFVFSFILLFSLSEDSQL